MAPRPPDPGDPPVAAEPARPPEEIAELERVLLGGERRYDADEVSRLAGVPREQADRLWRALGFPTAGEGDRAFTDADVDALRKLHALIEAGWLDDATALAMTHAVGQTMSRLAEWQLSTLSASGLPYASPEWALDRARNLVPEVERLMTYVWRRHLAALTARTFDTGAQSSANRLAVGFVDLVSYTSLTRHLSEQELATLVETFERIVSDTVAEHGGRVVKLIGDEVFFVADEPAAAAEIALAITERIAATETLPETRAGVASGTVLSRLGDVYGEPVNLAARLTAIARPGSVLVDRVMAEALAEDPRFRLRRVPPRPVRGYAMLQPFRLRRGEPEEPDGYSGT